MKNKLFGAAMLALTLFAFLVGSNTAQAAGKQLKQVEHKYVCMVNDTVFNMPQIRVDVGSKTYYGCCEMCKARLANDASVRTAKDPISGKTVDKAEAIIGVAPETGQAVYFESAENLKKYRY